MNHRSRPTVLLTVIAGLVTITACGSAAGTAGSRVAATTPAVPLDRAGTSTGAPVPHVTSTPTATPALTPVPTPFPTPAPTCDIPRAVAPAPSPAAWRVVEPPSASVAVRVPPTWRSFTPGGDFTNAIAAAEKAAFPALYGANPHFFVDTVDLTSGSTAPDPDLLLADISSGPIVHHLGTVMTVTADHSLTPADACDATAGELLTALQATAVGHAVTQRQVAMAGGIATEFSLTADLDAQTRIALVVVDVFERTPGAVTNWIIELVTTPDQLAGYLPTVRTMYSSFRPLR